MVNTTAWLRLSSVTASLLLACSSAVPASAPSPAVPASAPSALSPFSTPPTDTPTPVRILATCPPSSVISAPNPPTAEEIGSMMSLDPAQAVVASLAFSPAFESDATIFAGTYRRGLFRSTDGGVKWQSVNEGLTDIVVSVAVSPAFEQDGLVFAGTLDAGVFCSDDRGETWRPINQGLPSPTVISVVVSSSFDRDRTLFAVIALESPPSGAIVRSTDGGETWQSIDQGLANPIDAIFGRTIGVGPLLISPDFDTDGTLFAITELGRVFRSTNNADTWEPVEVPRGGCGDYVSALELSSAFGTDHTMFAVEECESVLRSRDGGATWEAIGGPEVAAFLVSLAVSPAFETDSTLYLSPNPPMRSALGVGTRGEGRGTRRSALDSDKWGRWRPLVGVGGADGGPGQRRWGGSAGQHAREDNRGPGRCDSVGWLSSLVDVSGAVGAVRQAMAGLAIEPGRE